MDIENLTKSQTVLLTLLVSFVTSIATGIVTITLMNQAPPAITQTIHKVVEKTIETATLPETQTATVVNEVVVKEENLISEVVNKNENSLVRVFDAENNFISLGVAVGKDGIIIASSKNISKDNSYYADSKNEIELEIITIDTKQQIAYLKTDDKIFTSSEIANSNLVKLGQTVICLNGIKSTEVSTGIISGITRDSLTRTASTTPEESDIVVISIKTNIPVSNEEFIGAPLFNLAGKVIGISTDSGSSFTPIDILQTEVNP